MYREIYNLKSGLQKRSKIRNESQNAAELYRQSDDPVGRSETSMGRKPKPGGTERTNCT